MTDTIQKIADEMERDASDIRLGRQWMSACEHYAKRLRALSARASAGEGGELDAHDFAYRHLSVPGCDGERAWTQWQQFGKDMQIRRLTAAPPARPW